MKPSKREDKHEKKDFDNLKAYNDKIIEEINNL